MAELNANLDRMVKQLKENGQWENTAIYITSEFARTITPNSNAGSDHGKFLAVRFFFRSRAADQPHQIDLCYSAYGQNTILLGGAVNGGKILGKYPEDISPNSPLADGSTRGRFIPTTSNDAIWSGILPWLGVPEADMDYCLPNRANTVNPFLGIESPLFTKDDLFVSAASGEVAETRRLRREA